MKGYRFVTNNLRSENGDVQWKIGEWVKYEGSLKLCESGFHACREPIDSLNYVYGSRWFEIDARGELLEPVGEDKFCASEMRLVEEIPSIVFPLFALECAKHVLSLWEKNYPDDLRPRKAIEAAEEYLRDPTEENKAAAVESAAWSAKSAAGAAAWAAGAAGSAAESAAWAAGAAGSAAESAAWSAKSAAGAAAWAARSAGAAERKWQNEKLLEIISKRRAET